MDLGHDEIVEVSSNIGDSYTLTNVLVHRDGKFRREGSKGRFRPIEFWQGNRSYRIYRLGTAKPCLLCGKPTSNIAVCPRSHPKEGTES